MTVTTRTYHEDKDFPWGLLGLIGLGGLFGLKRRPDATRRETVSIPEDFDAQTYLGLNPDVAKAGYDPREHYKLHGRREGRLYRRQAK